MGLQLCLCFVGSGSSLSFSCLDEAQLLGGGRDTASLKQPKIQETKQDEET